ncbi:M48 family metalloprotease [Halovulum dunhuangense]|uniref:M48 family metalloprotease n=1 Tax=Halovulum dunhuangense TaxID=1505036 RepID=A0A849L4E5_9RHOB|nr:M48 family metallopeptidase [Halovulum dunhuangense]NNU81226.1 M48 family metalloprotease [Halovulum dunhuangense]
MIRRLAILLAAFSLSGCVVATAPMPQRQPGFPVMPAATSSSMERFRVVVNRVEPVAEEACRTRRPDLNCDFLIVVEEDPRLAPNAFHTRDRSGRPVIGFTRSLIADARNPDELAFILGHEAAHHIRDHIPRAQSSATTGAALSGLLAAVLGASAEGVQQAANLGGFVNARRFSTDFELEADRLGTRIAARAGYDPVLGAAYFTRIPDPGNGFLASHPPNARRIETVREVAGRL